MGLVRHPTVAQLGSDNLFFEVRVERAQKELSNSKG